MDNERRRRAIQKIKSAEAAEKISTIPKKTSRFTGIPLLTGGPESNLMTWKKQIAELLLEMFGDLAKFTDTYEHYEPEEVEIDPELLTKEADPFGFNKETIKGKLNLREKRVEDLRSNWTPCYTIIKGTLSPEVEAKIKI